MTCVGLPLSAVTSGCFCHDASSCDGVLSLLQELTQTRHKLNQLEQQLQDSSDKAVQSEQQHEAVIMRLTRDLEQEQIARSYRPAPHLACMHALPTSTRMKYTDALPFGKTGTNNRPNLTSPLHIGSAI